MSHETIQRRWPRTPTLTPVLALLVLFAAGCSEQQSSAPQQTESTEAPAEQVMEEAAMPPAEMPEAAAEVVETAAAAAGDGEGVYQKACKTCHDAGIANAPKLGDSEAWAPRIAKGNDALFESVKNGLNAMPPKGACMSCSDDELNSAMQYMIAQSS